LVEVLISSIFSDKVFTMFILNWSVVVLKDSFSPLDFGHKFEAKHSLDMLSVLGLISSNLQRGQN
jgi:hypothetical protein